MYTQARQTIKKCRHKYYTKYTIIQLIPLFARRKTHTSFKLDINNKNKTNQHSLGLSCHIIINVLNIF